MLYYYNHTPGPTLFAHKDAFFYKPEAPEQNNLPRCFHREWIAAFNEKMYHLNKILDRLENKDV